MTIGEKIRNRRIELGLTQDELARKVGYKSRSSINKIECSRDLPSKKVRAFSIALDLPYSYLMGWEDDYKPLDFVVQSEPPMVVEKVISQPHEEYIKKYGRLMQRDKKLIDTMIDGMLENYEEG